MSTELTLSVAVDAAPGVVFEAATNWRRQSEWMLGTEVTVTGGDGRSVGSTMEAVTGVGPVGVTDGMEIVEWEPPWRCRVRHTGRVVRGDGVFGVREDGDGSVFDWSEHLDLPLGRLGELAWPLVRPAFALGLQCSLRRFARFARSYEPRS